VRVPDAGPTPATIQHSKSTICHYPLWPDLDCACAWLVGWLVVGRWDWGVGGVERIKTLLLEDSRAR